MSEPSPPAADPRQIWHVLRFNHFDPIWRRCWDRPMSDGRRRFASYRAIEERWLAEAFASCADGESCCMVECSWVLRHFLERHPEATAVLRRLAAEGRFELLGAGENILDANLVHGELLARNAALGVWWSERTLGARPTTGWHSDGFGSSAQMPQILRQCGYDWIPALSYRVPDAPYWRGLDGSTVLFACGAAHGGERLVHRIATRDCYQKLPPCPACAGSGCAACAGWGFAEGRRAELNQVPEGRLPGAAGVLMLWGEEILPGREVAAAMARINAERGDVRLRQGIYRDLRPHLADLLARVDDPPPAMVASQVENNPCHTGCYVSRIGMKQRHRALEHALLAAETWDALLAGGAGRERLREAWRRLTLSGFHDAITSSHADPAAEELRDLHDGLACAIAAVADEACARVLEPGDHAYTVFNRSHRTATAPVRIALPAGWSWAAATAGDGGLPVHDGGDGAIGVVVPAVPALGACTVRLRRAERPRPQPAERRVRCGALTVLAGEDGLADMAVDGLGPVAVGARLRIGELLLEHDIGDPWATRDLDRTRERLAPYTRLTGIERLGDATTITYAGHHASNDDPHRCADPAVTLLAWTQRFHLRDGVPWIEIETEVEWHTHNRRLRIAFPSATAGDRGVFDIPSGTLERDRYEGASTAGGNAGGDWPALHWAGIQAPDHTFAVLNRGTPSHRIEDGVVLVSVLRSPQLPYALHEPASYVLHNYHGMADHGRHRFRHALVALPGHWRDNGVGAQAELYNAGFQVVPGALARGLPGWRIDLAHARLVAVKTAEDGNGVVMRFVEDAGTGGSVRIVPPRGIIGAQRCSLLEDPGETLAFSDGAVAFALRPWQIASVRFASRSGPGAAV